MDIKITNKPSKPVMIGAYQVDDKLEGWEIVTEVGVGRWIGLVKDEPSIHPNGITLQPALELSAPSRAPVLAVIPGQGQVEGVISGFNAAFVLNQPSTHPVRLLYSSRQKCSEMSEDLRMYCFNIITDAVLGPVGRDGKRPGQQR